MTSNEREQAWKLAKDTQQVGYALENPHIRAIRHADDLVAAFDREERLREALVRATYLAEHLFAMVPRDVWRDSGGDDGQGHYEADYWAEQLQRELGEFAALSSPAEQ